MKDNPHKASTMPSTCSVCNPSAFPATFLKKALAFRVGAVFSIASLRLFVSTSDVVAKLAIALNCFFGIFSVAMGFLGESDNAAIFFYFKMPRMF
jgi:hypothetical protein